MLLKNPVIYLSIQVVALLTAIPVACTLPSENLIAMSYPRYTIFRDDVSEFRFNLKSKNGEIILRSSEGYINQSDCRHAISICQENSTHDSNYDKRVARNGQYYFTLQANNFEDTGISEEYTTVQSRDKGIADVKRDGPVLTVIENI